MATIDACVVALDASHRRRGLGQVRRRLERRLLHDDGAAGGEGQGDGRRLGRRVRHPRLHRRLDAETGEEAWKTYTVPGPGEPGHDTWKGDAWKTGGAPGLDAGQLRSRRPSSPISAPATAALDAGHAPGDNLYATSVIALDVETGRDQGPPPVPLERRLGLGRGLRTAADRRRARRPDHPGARPCRPQRLSLDAGAHAGRSDRLRRRRALRRPGRVQRRSIPKTGGPIYDETKIPGHQQEGDLLPVPVGRQGLAAGGLQPADRAVLHPGQREPLRRDSAACPWASTKPGELYIGVPIEDIFSSMRLRDGVDASKPVKIGELQAWDLSDRQEGLVARLSRTARCGVRC